jgi:hypothetical protein
MNAAVSPICQHVGCGRALRGDNVSGFCRLHHAKSPSHRATTAAYYQQNRSKLLQRAHIRKGFRSNYWQAGTCRIDGCDEILRSDNISGLCKYHRKLDWQRRNYDAHRAAEARHQRAYGLTLEQKRQMLAEQGGCGICAKPPTDDLVDWDTDHDHVTEKVRGVLCHNCNVGIGNLRDDPVILGAAIAYIMRSKT